MGSIQRNFKIFIVKPKLTYLRKNHKNYNKGTFLELNEFTLYMKSKIFDENSYYQNRHFPENRENHKKGEFVKMTI